MKIVHVVHGFESGGVVSVVKNLIKAQSKMEHEIEIITQPKDVNLVSEWLSHNNIKASVESFSPVCLHYPTITGCVIGCKRLKNKETVWHFHNPVTIGLLPLYRPSNAVCTIHGYNTGGNNISNFIFDSTLKKFARKNGMVVGCCNAVTSFYAKKLELKDSNKIATVENGTETEKKESPCFSTENKKLKIGYVSYIDELKGWEILANAYMKLSLQEKEKLTIVFAGKIDENEKEKFDSFCNNNPGILYLGYIKNVGATLLPYLDYVALPSRSEGLPMIILESLQAGTPVLATPVGGVPEAVVDGQSGYIVERSPDEWTRTLRRIIFNPVGNRELRKTARKTYESKFTSEIMASKYMEIYKRKIYGEQ